MNGRTGRVAAAVVACVAVAAWAGSLHRGGGVDDRRPACQAAAAWRDLVDARDASAANAIHTASASHQPADFRTAQLAVDRALVEGEPAPTVLAPWWESYKAGMTIIRGRMATAAAGQDVPPLALDIKGWQAGPMATAVAYCGGL